MWRQRYQKETKILVNDPFKTGLKYVLIIPFRSDKMVNDSFKLV